ncbi:MAG: glycosyltransferase family 39 protein [Candidatus Bathyarchaeota archaeon]
MAQFYQSLGPTLLAGQLVSLLFGGLLPIITFFLGKELFNKKTGLLSAFIVSINPLLILYSCLVFREMLFSFTWMCCIYFALRGFKGNTFYSILAGFFFALASMTVEIGIFTGIGFIVYFVVQKTLKNKGRLGELKNLDVFFCSAFLTLLPLFIRDYLVNADFFFSWTIFEYYNTPIVMYISLIGLSVPYVLLTRVLFHQPKFPSFDRFSNVIKISLVGVFSLAAVLVVGYFSGLFSGTLELLFAQSFTGFVKFVEYMAFPEALGLFLSLFSLVAIVYGLKSRDIRALTIFCLTTFLFSYAVRAIVLSTNYSFWGNYGVIDLLTWSGGLQQVTWPFQVIFRYPLPFYPLFSIFASFGIFFICDRLLGKSCETPTSEPTTQKNERPRKNKIAQNQLVKKALVSIMVFIIIFAYSYAQADLFARADSHDSYQNPRLPANVEPPWWYREGGESLSLIDWLHDQGSPVVYSFNSMFKKQYGEDKVILLNGNESLIDIVNQARKDNVEYIISDAWGTYSDAQYELYRAGINDREPRFEAQPLGYYELVRSYSHWHMAQVFKISIPERMALVVQGTASTGAPWLNFLSNMSSPYIVTTVDDEKDLTDFLTTDYDVIVITEIQRHLEDDELEILRERVEKGTVLIINGIAPAFMNLNENSYWLGAERFSEAPTDAKMNITFTENALTVLPQINLDRSYVLYSQSLYSSPTGCTGIESDVTIYANRVEDEATTIFAKPFLEGTVIFSGVRHTHAQESDDYGLYMNFLQNLLNETG